nr:hypothetical protein [Tanacetum cinerariifolium]
MELVLEPTQQVSSHEVSVSTEGVEELKRIVFKKNNVLFTDIECLVLSLEIKLPDENQVLLRVPRESNMYNVDLKNIVPSGDLTCLFAKFCGMKGIKMGFSVPRTPQQNGIAERKNRTLIEAARTMLVDSLLPIPFWAEAVNTACYVQNKGFLVGYSVSSKAFCVFNSRTRIVQETLHINFLENKTNVVGVQEQFDVEKAGEDNVQQYVIFFVWSSGSTNPHNTNDDAAFGGKKPEFEGRKPKSEVHVSLSSSAKTKKHDDKTKREAKGKSPIESSIGYRNLSVEFEDFTNNNINKVNAADSPVPAVGQVSTNSTNTFSAVGPSNTAGTPTHGKSSYVNTSQYPDDPNMPELEDITYFDGEEDVGAEADFTNLETTITVSPIPTTRVHKDHPVTQIIGDLSLATQIRRHTQEDGIDYEEVSAPVARIEAIRLFLAYASFMGFIVYQMDVKRAFLYGTIEEEVYVCQPPRFEDPVHPDKLYKVVKALYGLHQALRACSMGELTFFLGLQVKQKPDGIFICQDKYVAKILRKFGLTDGKSASTPIDTEKPLLKDPDGEDVDVYTYRSMIGSLLYLTSSRPDIMGKPHLGLWYPKDSPFNLVAYLDSDYAGASLDRKSTTGDVNSLDAD